MLLKVCILLKSYLCDFLSVRYLLETSVSNLMNHFLCLFFSLVVFFISSSKLSNKKPSKKHTTRDADTHRFSLTLLIREKENHPLQYLTLLVISILFSNNYLFLTKMSLFSIQ